MADFQFHAAVVWGMFFTFSAIRFAKLHDLCFGLQVELFTMLQHTPHSVQQKKVDQVQHSLASPNTFTAKNFIYHNHN